jgi:hypothetical protein
MNTKGYEVTLFLSLARYIQIFQTMKKVGAYMFSRDTYVFNKKYEPITTSPVQNSSYD